MRMYQFISAILEMRTNVYEPVHSLVLVTAMVVHEMCSIRVAIQVGVHRPICINNLYQMGLEIVKIGKRILNNRVSMTLWGGSAPENLIVYSIPFIFTESSSIVNRYKLVPWCKLGRQQQPLFSRLSPRTNEKIITQCAIKESNERKKKKSRYYFLYFMGAEVPIPNLKWSTL